MPTRLSAASLKVFVFLGAFLMFTMEPMVGRILLPRFGGAFHVWTTTLMFFQGALFLGYCYAHLIAKRLGRLHLVFLLLPIALLPPMARGAGTGHDTLALLTELVVSFCLPFAALATTGVVAQTWFARSDRAGGGSPFHLYAISNAGSLLALLSYVLVIEPLLGVSTQRWLWAGGYLLYLVSAVVAYAGMNPFKAAVAVPVEVAGEAEARPGARKIIGWLLLSAMPSIFLMAVTNLIALDVGNAPLFWVIPLALYLLTFILVFAEPSRAPRWLRRSWPYLGLIGLYYYAGGGNAGTAWAYVVVQLLALFAVCMGAHTELYRQRPSSRYLTLYYLVNAVGGWAGGAFVALLAPTAFNGLYEYQVGLFGLFLVVAVLRREELRTWVKGRGRLESLVAVAVVVTFAGKFLVVESRLRRHPEAGRALAVERNFYGIHSVRERKTSDGLLRELVSGRTLHGGQLQSEDKRREPLSYYRRTGAVGDAMTVLSARQAGPRRIAAIGLGVGTLAAYVEPDETIDFYEIDPTIVDLAQKHFTYLSDCRGGVRMTMGDARLTLAERAKEKNPGLYDLIVVDAFSGDAVPMHLLTNEAVALYRSLLAKDGLLLLHISNRYYSFAPVLATIARHSGLAAASKLPGANVGLDGDRSKYFVMAESDATLTPLVDRGFVRVTAELPRQTSLWTDDHANALGALFQ